MSHALIVGGTGMLTDVTQYLLTRHSVVSLIARNPGRFTPLAHASGVVQRIAVDYSNSQELLEVLEHCKNDYGQIDTVVAWIHETAPDAPFQIAASTAVGEGTRYIQVLGSTYGRNIQQADALLKRLQESRSLEYSQVILGGIQEEDEFRWLTHKEICAGIVRVIQSCRHRTVVGQIPDC